MIAWYHKDPVEVADARGLPGWGEFHRVCGDIDVYFDKYEVKKRKATVQVFTVRDHPHIPKRCCELVFLCVGEGHDIISASIDGLRKSGGSSLRAKLAALTLQLEQLAGMFDDL